VRTSPAWPKDLPRTLTLPATSVWYNLEVTARRYPTKAAFICYDSVLTFERLHAEALALAGFLQQRCGVAKGERVVIFAQNSFQFAIAYYAILRADAVVVPLSPMNLTAELARYLKDCGARTAIVAQELWAQAAPLVADGSLEHAIVAAYSDYLTSPPTSRARRLQLPRQAIAGRGVAQWPEAIAAALQPGRIPWGRRTSAACPTRRGPPASEGMHAHEPLGDAHDRRGDLVDADARGIESLGVLPWFHVNRHAVQPERADLRRRHRLPPSTLGREVAGDLIRRYRPTFWTLIPTMVVDLLASPNAESFDLSSLQRMNGGGAAMPEAVAAKLKAQYGITFSEGYGLTETMAPTHMIRPTGRSRNAWGSPRSIPSRWSSTR
jgi:fatty-acyl-CoA synthase